MRKTIEQDRLLDDIVLKVIELDEQKKFDKQLREKIRDHIDTLNEVTDLDREEIEALAEQIVSKHSAMRRPSKAAILAGMLILGGVLIAFYFTASETKQNPLEATTLSKLRPQYIQEKLALVLNSTNPLKLNFLEHWMVTGRAPYNFKELGMLREDFVDGDLIKNVTFLEDGINIFLGEDMGDEAWITLIPDIQDNRVKITWQCYTNIPQKLLGAKKAALCWTR